MFYCCLVLDRWMVDEQHQTCVVPVGGVREKQQGNGEHSAGAMRDCSCVFSSSERGSCKRGNFGG